MGSTVDEVDEHIDPDLTDLGAIMDTVMGRQWFQLYVNREVDDEMVRKRWGVPQHLRCSRSTGTDGPDARDPGQT